jgi:hypothetical protein
VTLDRVLIQQTLGIVLERVERNVQVFGDRFPTPSTFEGVYPMISSSMRSYASAVGGRRIGGERPTGRPYSTRTQS